MTSMVLLKKHEKKNDGIAVYVPTKETIVKEMAAKIE
jgi:hypothetical protein